MPSRWNINMHSSERDRLFVIGSIMTLILGLMGVVLLAIAVLDLWT